MLECSLCLESFNDPRILPCGHTFCLLCLQRLVAVKNATHHLCSICRVPWATPKDGLGALPKNFVAKSIVSLPPPVPSSSDATMMCSVHVEEKVQVYCRTCDQLTCTKCVIKSHRYHELVEEIAEADKVFIDKLTDCRRHVQTTHSEWSQEFDRLEARTTLLKQQKTEATKNFDDSVNDVEEHLRAAFDSLISELRQQKSARCNAFEEQLDKEIQYAEKAKEVATSKLETCKQNMLAIDKALSATIQDRCEYVSKVLPTTTCEKPTAKLKVLPNETTSSQTYDIWKSNLVTWQKKTVKTVTQLTTTIGDNLSATPG
jgi:tripartite motif-containing protein 2/3